MKKQEPQRAIHPPAVTCSQQGHFPASTGKFTLVQSPTLLVPIRQISCGHDFTVLLDANMGVHSFGANEHGQLGHSPKQNYVSDIRNVHLGRKANIERVSCGSTHVVVFGERECHGWGQHEMGALGYQSRQVINTWMPRKLPILISPHQKLIDVSCGNNTTVLNIYHNFYCLGDNRVGQLGLIIKKTYFQPQLMSIASTKISKAPKLKSVKAGNGFTAGLDEAGILYGAGDFSKLNLSLRSNSLLPMGLCCVQQATKDGYKGLIDVENFYCGSKLLVKFRNCDQYAAFGCRKTRINIQIDQNSSHMGQSSGFVMFQNQNEFFRWSPQSTKLDGLQKIVLPSRHNILLDCTETGKIICVQNSPNESSFQPKLEEQMLDQGQKQVNGLEIESNHERRGAEQELNLLRKEISQQKEIIKLFQQYVSKLEGQNRQLKSKLELESKTMPEKDDAISNRLTLLKVMLRDMVKQHTRVHGHCL